MLTILLSLNCLFGQESPEIKADFPHLEGPFLGQRPPGMNPELFAPGIVSTEDLEMEGVFSPDMEEFYFVRQSKGEEAKTHVVKYENGIWRKPLKEERLGEVSISTDGKTMYLGNKYRKRTSTGWSELKSLGPTFETFPIMRLTASEIGTYVFDEREEIGTLRYSRIINGKREEPQAFSAEINTGKWTAHPFIAPDESFLIWDSERDGGYGDSDLYISFRQEDGSWGPAVNMGANINSENEDIYGSVTPDGRFFFFSRINLAERRADIFWVDTRVIENLREKFKP
jgi:hypothetical protein